MQRLRAGERVELAEADDLRSLGMALQIERMIRDGVAEEPVLPGEPWSTRSA
jgi:hypothetical protein